MVSRTRIKFEFKHRRSSRQMANYVAKDPVTGNTVYKTFDEVNAEVKAESRAQPQDPTKPGEIIHMICGGVRGKRIYEAKVRLQNRAFLHIISWSEFKPYLPLLAIHGINCKHLMNKEEGEDNFLDFSWENISAASDTIAKAMTMIMAVRQAKWNESSDEKKELIPGLKRGDCVHLQFIGYRCYGTYFWDGTKVIPPEDEDSDYYRVPSEFKIPTQFPLDCWNPEGSGLVGACSHIAGMTVTLLVGLEPVISVLTSKLSLERLS